jgi:aldehyde dehydrogenase (NAD+)
VRDFYGEDPKKSPDFARIVTQRHFQRLSNLISVCASVPCQCEQK